MEGVGMKPYERYCSLMRERGLKPSMNEAQLLEAWGIKKDTISEALSIRPKRDARKVSASIGNHIKITSEAKPKKAPKAKKEPKPKKPKAVKEQPKPKKPKLTKEQRAEKKRKYQREYMVKWRALHPKAAYQSVKAWREKSEENMEKHRKWNRERMKAKRAEKLTA